MNKSAMREDPAKEMLFSDEEIEKEMLKLDFEKFCSSNKPKGRVINKIKKESNFNSFYLKYSLYDIEIDQSIMEIDLEQLYKERAVKNIIKKN